MVNMNCSFKRKRPDARRLVVPGLIIALSALLLLAFPSVSFAETSGTVVAWGDNYFGECNVPAPNSDFVAVAGGYYNSLGLKSDGTVVAWGNNDYGQCDVPAPNSDFVAVSAFLLHSLGLKSDGTVVAWGYNEYGECNVPAPNSDFVAVAAGYWHSLGLKSDGTVVAWGWNEDRQCNVPAPNSDFVAVAAGGRHSLGLKSDGTVVAWGYNDDGQCNVPAPNSDFVAVAGGNYHSLGLKSDGTVVAWGWNTEGECNVPAPNSDFVAVAGGVYHTLGLKSDGTVVAWGWNGNGECNVPAPNSDFVAVAGGFCISLAIQRGEPPNVSSIDPSEGVQGTTVDVTNLAGTGFQDGATVRLEKAGETAIDATDVVFVSSSKLTCKLPLLGDTAVGTWDLVVKNPDDQEGRLDDGFTVTPALTVTSITPKTGVKGWRVTITDLAGTGFQTGATVKLEQPSSSTVIDATNVNVESDTKITCEFTLSGPLGKYDVVVKNPDDQEVKLVNGFSITNICGLGGGAIMLGFGLMMGLLSLAGSEILRKRRRRIKAG